jgi:hypothetical protein
MLPFMTQFGTLPPQMQQQLLQSHLVLTQQQMQQLQQQGLRPPATGAFPTLPLPLGTAFPATAAAGTAVTAPAAAGTGAGAPKLAPPAPATSLPPPQPLTGVEGALAAAAVAAIAGDDGALLELPPAEATHEQVGGHTMLGSQAECLGLGRQLPCEGPGGMSFMLQIVNLGATTAHMQVGGRLRSSAVYCLTLPVSPCSSSAGCRTAANVFVVGNSYMKLRCTAVLRTHYLPFCSPRFRMTPSSSCPR